MKILLIVSTLAALALGIALLYFRETSLRTKDSKYAKKKLNPYSIFGTLSLITAAVFATALCAEFFPIDLQQSWLYATMIYVIFYLISKRVAEEYARRKR